MQHHVASVHDGKKPFKPEACDNSTILKGELQYHVASVHEGRKPFKCESCDNSSVIESYLQHHVATGHEGKKPFKCEAFDRIYSNSEKPFGVVKAFCFKFVNVFDVTKINSYIKNTKAFGVDNIFTEVWKKGMITLAGTIA